MAKNQQKWTKEEELFVVGLKGKEFYTMAVDFENKFGYHRSPDSIRKKFLRLIGEEKENKTPVKKKAGSEKKVSEKKELSGSSVQESIADLKKQVADLESDFNKKLVELKVRLSKAEKELQATPF